MRVVGLEARVPARREELGIVFKPLIQAVLHV
jgi:hypothetical protein